MILTLSSLYMRYLVHIYCIDFVNVWMFAGIFSCTPSFSPDINKVYLILSYIRLVEYIVSCSDDLFWSSLSVNQVIHSRLIR